MIKDMAEVGPSAAVTAPSGWREWRSPTDCAPARLDHELGKPSQAVSAGQRLPRSRACLLTRNTRESMLCSWLQS